MRHLEITTIVPCPNRCSFCPQDKLAVYTGESELTLENFKLALSNTPKDVSIHFSGFGEPLANKQGYDMIRYAYDNGYAVQLYTRSKIDHSKLDGISFEHLCINDVPTKPISRAGNLYKVEPKPGKLTCSKSPAFEQNVMLPDGSVYLCCMDYSLQHWLGNLFKTNFNDLARGDEYELCRYCESATQ